MKKWLVNIMTLLVVFGGLPVSCIDDHEVSCPVVQLGEPDAELMLTVKFSSNAVTKAGDPGTDHGENTDGWETVGIYLVYRTGHIMQFRFTKESFETPKIYSVFSGTADVYVVALPAGQTLPDVKAAGDIRYMKTLDVCTAFSSGSDRLDYMRNIFSGYYPDFVIRPDENNVVTVRCPRLAAKVDMQYDVQNGIENGKFVRAEMSEITFWGVPQGYVFPALAGMTDAVQKDIITVSGNISERNGRAYAYMFPGKSSMVFGIDYTVDGAGENKVSYEAVFQENLRENAWYKVNFTVSGRNASATDIVDVTIK